MADKLITLENLETYKTNEETKSDAKYQTKLTTASVNDGTIDKSIGFDSQGNVVKGNAGGGGGGTQLYKHSVITTDNNSISIISTNSTSYAGASYIEPNLNNVIAVIHGNYGMGSILRNYDSLMASKFRFYNIEDEQEVLCNIAISTDTVTAL